MALTQNSDAVTKHIAGTLVKVEAALEDILAYYKFGRHEIGSPEKVYFLLSYCSHLLFLLWRTEQDDGGTIFRETQHLAAFQTDLDFGTLRYTDYTRRMLHADSFEEHLKNEPQWFKFWLKLRCTCHGHIKQRHLLNSLYRHEFRRTFWLWNLKRIFHEFWHIEDFRL